MISHPNRAAYPAFAAGHDGKFPHTLLTAIERLREIALASSRRPPRTICRCGIATTDSGISPALRVTRWTSAPCRRGCEQSRQRDAVAALVKRSLDWRSDNRATFRPSLSGFPWRRRRRKRGKRDPRPRGGDIALRYSSATIPPGNSRFPDRSPCPGRQRKPPKAKASSTGG